MKHSVLLTAIAAMVAAVGVAALAGCEPTEADPTAESPGAEQVTERPLAAGGSAYAFTGRVADIVYRGKYSGVATLTTWDKNAGWVVVIEDVQPVSGQAPGEGGTAAYLIHSPVRLFAAPADEVIGKTYHFTAFRGVDTPIVDLEATPVEAAD